MGCARPDPIIKCRSLGLALNAGRVGKTIALCLPPNQNCTLRRPYTALCYPIRRTVGACVSLALEWHEAGFGLDSGRDRCCHRAR